MNMDSDYYKELRNQIRSENNELVDKVEEDEKVRNIRFIISVSASIFSMTLLLIFTMTLLITQISAFIWISVGSFVITVLFALMIPICDSSANKITDLDKQVNDLINEKFVKDLKEKYDAVLNNSESVLIDKFGNVIENFRVIVDNEKYDAVIVYKNDEIEILEAKPVVEIAMNPLYKKKAKNRENSEINVFDLKESLNKI